MKLAKFLDKYDTVIFDMDGVITSEQNYWNCAALTVWEYLNYKKLMPQSVCKIFQKSEAAFFQTMS